MKYGKDSSPQPSFDSDVWMEATRGPNLGGCMDLSLREKHKTHMVNSGSSSSCSLCYGVHHP